MQRRAFYLVLVLLSSCSGAGLAWYDHMLVIGPPGPGAHLHVELDEPPLASPTATPSPAIDDQQ